MTHASPLLPRAGRRWGTLRAALTLLASLLAMTALTGGAEAQSRLKDIVDVEGVRDNMLVGYGLVVGLNASGDTLNGSPFTEQSLVGMLERLGVNVRDEQLKTRNVAAVMVTATLPPFTRQGSRIDVSVSSLGDAKSLAGGQLLVTPLLGADGEVYAVGQGSVAIGGFTASGDAQTVTQNTPTAGRIASGAIVEREVPFSLSGMNVIKLSLRNPDFTTARRIQDAINGSPMGPIARATDPATVEVTVPPQRIGDIVGLMTDIEQIRVEPDQVARVVIDERSGIIVMGKDVRISTVAISQGNLTVRVTETPQVSQPNPLSQNGDTTVVPRSNVEVDTGDDSRLAILPDSVSLQDLVASLNSLGVGPRDMISILQSIKAAGALQAEIEVM